MSRHTHSLTARPPEAPEGLWSERAMHPSLAQLRDEIDRIDLELMERFERRLAVAARIGAAKDAVTNAGPHIRPDREQAILDRLTRLGLEENRSAICAIWREIMGWSTARQGRLQVRVWSPGDASRTLDAARRRFGAAADIQLVQSADEALDHAMNRCGVSVLRVNSDAWWVGLRRQWSELSVFDGLGPVGGAPTALAVGRIDPTALPAGRRVVVSAGGDAGDGGGSRRWGITSHHGWTLALTDASGAGEIEGWVGSIASDQDDVA